jgi:hypothetical protein
MIWGSGGRKLFWCFPFVVLMSALPLTSAVSQSDHPHSYLGYLEEPDLSQRPSNLNGKTIYRFVSHDSEAGEYATALRIDIGSNGNAVLMVKKTTSTIDGSAPKLEFNRSRPLTSAETAEFLQMIDRSGFWHLDPAIPKELSCTAGSLNMLEGLRDGQYHSVSTLCWEIPEMVDLFKEANKLDSSVR